MFFCLYVCVCACAKTNIYIYTYTVYIYSDTLCVYICKYWNIYIYICKCICSFPHFLLLRVTLLDGLEPKFAKKKWRWNSALLSWRILKIPNCQKNCLKISKISFWTSLRPTGCHWMWLKIRKQTLTEMNWLLVGGENSQDIILRSDSCLTWWSQNGEQNWVSPMSPSMLQLLQSSFLDASTTTKNWTSPWFRLQSQCHQAFQKMDPV